MTEIDPRVEKATREFCHKYRRLREEIGKAIVGHGEIVDGGPGNQSLPRDRSPKA